MSLFLEFGDFQLDEARFELRRRGQPIAVQPKVIDLILYLARHRTRVVGKEELFDTVWKGVVVSQASLSQALSLARRALDDSPEAQHTIRTVRSKGLQFVAFTNGAAAPTVRDVPRSRPPVDAPRPAAPAATTQLETALDELRSPAEIARSARLFLALACESPVDGGASWSLADIDEVHIVRGSERRHGRQRGLTRTLKIAVVGRLMSRRHARLVRGADGWLIVDEQSRNGTYLNGERIDKRSLSSGDLIECGRTFFRFDMDPPIGGTTLDVDSRSGAASLLSSVTPRLLALEHDVRRIASSLLPVLITGESGVGKTRLAEALHDLSGCGGPLVRIRGASLNEALSAGGIDRGRQGTLLIENVERVPPELIPTLEAVLESRPSMRVVSTSVSSATALEGALPPELLTRLSGYRCELPPLREQLGDLGALVASALQTLGCAALELDIAAARALFRHSWPGNLRELFHVMEVATTLSDGGGVIGLDHLPPELRAGAG